MLTTAPHLQVRRPSPTTAEFTVTTCLAPTLSNRLLFGLVLLLRLSLALSALLLLHSTWPLSSPFHDPDLAPPTSLAPATTPAIATSTYTQAQNGSIAVVKVAPPTEGLAETGTITLQQQQRKPAPAPARAITTTTTTLALPPRPSILLTLAWLPYALARIHATAPATFLITRAAAAVPPSLLLPLCAALLYLTTLRIHTTESLLVLRGLGIQTSSSGGSYLASWRAGTRFIPTDKIRDVLINEAFRGFGVRYYLVVVVDGEEDVVVVFPRLLPGRAVVEGVWRGVRGCLWESRAHEAKPVSGP